MDLRELYMEFVMDQASRPRNYRAMDDATACEEAENPSCGDHLHLYVKSTDGKTIEDISFIGESCALCKASASTLTTQLKGKSLAEADTLRNAFEEMVTGTSEEIPDTLKGNIKLFQSVRHFPQRVSCVLLGWKALGQVLTNLPSNK
jgi:nitrogen fixation NifU-like protein